MFINFCETLKLQTTGTERRRLGLLVDTNVVAGDVGIRTTQRKMAQIRAILRCVLGIQ